VTAIFSWGPGHSQLSDAFLRPIKQDFTNNLRQFFLMLFLHIIFNTSI